MKLNKNILPTILLGGLLIGLSLLSQEEVGNRFLLPEDFKVYAGNHGVVNHPVQGLTEKTLTTRNLFQKTPGCYIACYSRDPEKGSYDETNTINIPQFTDTRQCCKLLFKKKNNGERSQSQTYSPVTVNRHLYSQPSDRLWFVRIELMAEPSR
jgi:hypothetical protein